MAVTFERNVLSGRKQAFWRGEAKMLPAGFHVANTINVGAVLKRGAFVQVDFDTLSAGIVKVGVVLQGGTTSKPRVAKDNYFEVGDKVFKVGGTAGVTISAIDHSHDEYDELTLSSAITGLAKDDFLQECVVAEDGTASARYTPNAVLGADKEWKKNSSESVDVAYEVVVLKDHVPAFPASWIAQNGFHMVNNPSIRFIKQ